MTLPRGAKMVAVHQDKGSGSLWFGTDGTNLEGFMASEVDRLSHELDRARQEQPVEAPG
ncbi:hypothetical protein ACQBAU_12730 [Propionibacteriaceae bacterium Y2011]